jgi:hypothetical protein
MQVRQQPSADLATLRRRLRQNFEYSCEVDHSYVRQVVGRALSTYRNKLMNKIRAGEPCPPGVTAEVWESLKKKAVDPSHEERSARMRYANECRITPGMTGPRGEEGVREMLRKKLGKSPNFDDVFEEMNRDKGYAGVAARRRIASQSKMKISSARDSADVLEDETEVSEDGRGG